jgi:peptidoglycan/xylan/chitin deacetylase (PgdA/CDA1 family)
LIAHLGCRPITLDTLVDWMVRRETLPPSAVVITFDDGYEGNYRHAFPALRRRRFPATFFVVTAKIGDSAMMTWSQLREMHAGGMAVESHTATHPLLSTLTAAETLKELNESKRMIESRLGCLVRHLSLPNGDSNPWCAGIAARLGYRTACGSRFGMNGWGADPFLLRRIAVKKALPERRLAAYLSGDRPAIAVASGMGAAKHVLARLLTKRLYDRLYNQFFGIEEQRKSLSR